MNKRAHLVYGAMAAQRYTANVLEMFYGPINRTENAQQRRPITPHEINGFIRIRNNFQGWLRVWLMTVTPGKPFSQDLLEFAREKKKNFVALVEREIEALNSIKVSFGLEAKFDAHINNSYRTMIHYFKGDTAVLDASSSSADIRRELDRFIQKAKGEIEAWSAQGSGWVIENIESAYVNVARYQPLRGGNYIPLPAKLKAKRAIINVRNRDNECIKWALRAALFPPKNGKKPQRTSKYPVRDGLDYRGIDFPTPLKQISRLEEQNGLAINVLGWEEDEPLVYRLSKRPKKVKRINLMLLEKDGMHHYCYIKNLSALLHRQNKDPHKKHPCMLCMTYFTREELLAQHAKHCNGVNGAPTRIEMPEQGKNTLEFKNFHKQMKAPFVIYADFEALVRKMQGRERDPEKQKSCTDKTAHHEACGYSYIVVRSDGSVSRQHLYRGPEPVKRFLGEILREEAQIREYLSHPARIVMRPEDWENFKSAAECRICNEPLNRETFLDSLPVWNQQYLGQSHKRCYYVRKKQNPELCLKKTEQENRSNACSARSRRSRPTSGTR